MNRIWILIFIFGLSPAPCFADWIDQFQDTVNFSRQTTRLHKKPVTAPRHRSVRQATTSHSERWQKVSRSTIDNYIVLAGRKYGLRPEFIRAVVWKESAFKNSSLSRVGAMGLMQLMPQTAKDLNVKNPWDPKENIFGGTRYLKSLLMEFRRVDHALAAYNFGPGRVKRGAAWPKETREYVPKVIKRFVYYTNQNAVAKK